MIHEGENRVEGVDVRVRRKRIRGINIRVAGDGSVNLSLPMRWASLRQAEEFLREKWPWVLKAREKALEASSKVPADVTSEDRERLTALVGELTDRWMRKLGETDVTWKLRRMKSLWGSCQWRKRVLTFNLELAYAPRELTEYVVVHELTHFRVHGHGPRFCELMDARLSDWRELRARLNRRDFVPRKPIQSEFDFG